MKPPRNPHSRATVTANYSDGSESEHDIDNPTHQQIWEILANAGYVLPLSADAKQMRTTSVVLVMSPPLDRLFLS